MEALCQPPCRTEPPRQLRKDLVLLVGSGERRVGARLCVVIAKVLVSREEAQSIGNDRPADIRRQIAIPGALVAALHTWPRWYGSHNRLAGERSTLRVVRQVRQKSITPLPGDDVDDCALNVAELGGRADRLDMDLLDEVDARLGPRDAIAGTGEVRPVEEKLVLVGAGAER